MQIYYKIHSYSFGDTLAATPTLRYLSNSHKSKINVVTHNTSIFKNNPYVNKVLSFNEYEGVKSDTDVVYNSFTSTGRPDERGIEKKFGHIDIRQLHAMDLGFQLPPENLHYDFYPQPIELKLNLPNEYIVLHITNNWPNRTWEYEKWKKLIRWLSDNKIFTVLIGFGHREIVHHSISNVPLEKQCPSFDNLYGLDLANQGTMSDMWHVINGAKCIVTMDTGPLHLAGTTDTHIIQLGSAVHPSFRAPYRNGSQNYKYDYVGGDCNLFCNSNLLYNVKEWGHINSVPPQTGCLEGYSEFRCHPTIDSVINSISKIIKPVGNILVDVKWDGSVISYNFKKSLDSKCEIVMRDSITNFKMYSLHHDTMRVVDGHYWMSVQTDKNLTRDVNVELYLGGVLVETHFIKRDNPEIFSVDGTLIDNNLMGLEANTDNYFMTFYEIFLHNTYNRYGITVNEGDVVLDIGANVGFFTLYSLMRGASKVISVEPDNRCYSIVESLSNRFNKIQPINYAVYDGSNVEFNLHNDASSCNYISNTSYVPDDNNTKSVVMESVHINDLLESIDSSVDLLKLDCEGAEDLIIDTIDISKLKNIPKLIIEAHTNQIRDKIESKLKNNGYVVSVDNVFGEIYMMYCTNVI